MIIFEYLFGVLTGGELILACIQCFKYVIIGMLLMRLLKKNFPKLLVFIPVIVLIICVYEMRLHIGLFLEHINTVIVEYKRVSGFSSEAYREYMSYLYLEPLGLVIFRMMHFIPYISAPILTFLDYKKINQGSEATEEKNQQNEEIRKMKIQDL